MLGNEQTLTEKKSEHKHPHFSISGAVKRLRGEKKSHKKPAESELPETTEIITDTGPDLDPITVAPVNPVETTTATSDADTTVKKTKHRTHKHHDTNETEGHKKKRHHKSKHRKKELSAEKEELESAVDADAVNVEKETLETTPLAVVNNITDPITTLSDLFKEDSSLPFPPVPTATLGDSDPVAESENDDSHEDRLELPLTMPERRSPRTSSSSVPLPESPRDPSSLQKLSDWSKAKANRGYTLAEDYIPGFKYSMNNAVKPAANGIYAVAAWSGQKFNQTISQPALNYLGKPLWNHVGEPIWRRAGQPIWNGLNNYIINPAWQGLKSGFNWTGAQLAAGFDKLKPKAKAVNTESASSTPAAAKDNNTAIISKTRSWLPGFLSKQATVPAAKNDAISSDNLTKAKPKPSV
jgi:hypothetical protein